MDSIFDRLPLADVQQDIARNIASRWQPQNSFDDLSDSPAEWILAQQVEEEVKPPLYRSLAPIIRRPFEEADWLNAINWPFKHWQASRFSDGYYGAWYGSDTVETTVYESAYHWYHGLIADAGFEREAVVSERKVFSVACSAALLDFRQATVAYPALLHPADYSFSQSVGARIHNEGNPGLLIQSARRPEGENVVIFNPIVLSNPRVSCQLSYRLSGGKILVEKLPDTAWLSLDVANFLA